MEEATFDTLSLRPLPVLSAYVPIDAAIQGLNDRYDVLLLVQPLYRHEPMKAYRFNYTPYVGQKLYDHAGKCDYEIYSLMAIKQDVYQVVLRLTDEEANDILSKAIEG